MSTKRSPREKELLRLEREEMAFRRKHAEKNSSLLSRFLADKVPAGLQSSLDEAFEKAFAIVFEKGTGIIEHSYNRKGIEKRFENTQAGTDAHALRSISQNAEGGKLLNTALSGIAGIGMGFLGIGIPDIVLSTALMLKTVYETALNYGYEYDSNTERCFILRLIHAAVSHGDDFVKADKELDAFIEKGAFDEPIGILSLIKDAANALSTDLLYMKFLQTIPVVGVVGGAYDAVFVERIGHYAELKYRKRFYKELKKEA